MATRPNLNIYRLYAPVYDLLFGKVLAAARRRAVQLLDLQPGERLLIPGIGTGLDLPLLVPGAQVTGVDLSPVMLDQAARKVGGRKVHLLLGDAQASGFPDGCFDAALLSLILSVAPDGRAAMHEAWRTLRVGGRMVIFDKFMPEAGRYTLARRILGQGIRFLGTDPNRRLSEIFAGISGMQVAFNEPSLLRGQYRILLLYKQ